MSTKSRPVACCTNPVIPVPLSASAEDQLISGLKALADPTSLAIFRLIAAQDEPICVGGPNVNWDASAYARYAASGGQLISAFVRASKP